jgi:hypothetical protein
MNITKVCRVSAAIAVLATAGLVTNVGRSDPARAPTVGAFVNRADMLNWLADGERGLWIQANNLRWFYARFTDACRGLNSTNSLVFDTRVLGKIDQAASVLVPGHGRCKVQTLAPSSGPPKDRNAHVAQEPQTQ